MTTVKYQVISMVGEFTKGDIIDAILFIEGQDNEALIMHPEDSPYCACLEIVVKGADGIYRSKSEDSWINLPKEWEQSK